MPISSPLGDLNPNTTLPPTPKQTPTSVAFPSPVFAEEYSVFNATPGNLSGDPGLSGRFPSFTPGGHKRILSTDSTATELPNPIPIPTSHAVQLRSDPTLHPALVHPAHQLPSTSQPLRKSRDEASRPGPVLASPDSTNPEEDDGKHVLPDPSRGLEPTQTATPPPTGHRDRHWPSEAMNMQQDGQEFGQPDFTGGSQPHDLSGLLGSPGDLFSYPMSAPVTAPDNFWDPSGMALPMDMDFGASAMFQQEGPSGHRQSGSFDWNNDVNMFQDPQRQPQPASSARPQKDEPQPKRTRTLAPKPPSSNRASNSFLPGSLSTSALLSDGNFGGGGGAMGQGTGLGVDPGVLFGRPQTAVDTSFSAMDDDGSAQAALADPNRTSASGGIRRSASVKAARNGKMPDRAFASSPLKPSSARPGLSRSQSENHGRRPFARGAHAATQPPGSRPSAVVRNGASMVDLGRPPAWSARAPSPLKKQNRLSGLASIPESSPRRGSRASVKFYIGADGRAHAEAAESAGEEDQQPGRARVVPRPRSSADLQQWDDEYDSSSTDDDPIIIPTRNNSFNKSFALPDPKRPVGSIFHPSRRSISDRSTSTGAGSDSQNLAPNDGDSDAETVMHDGSDPRGPDAARELLKVKESRQQRPAGPLSSSKSRRFFSLTGRSIPGSSVSPTRPGTGTTSDEPNVRCVCHRSEILGFLVQW